MATRDIVVVGASAGGVEPLMRLVAGFGPEFPAAVFIVLHTPPNTPSALPAILTRSGALPAEHARDEDTIEHGRIYVARPNHHLYVHRGHVRVAVGPHENSARPAVDVLFRSASRAYGRRVIGVVLSGALNDGALGLAAIKARGGVAIVQDPADALFEGMPRSALETTEVDYCLPVDEIARVVMRVVASTRLETDVSEEVGPEEKGIVDEKEPGKASGLTCPECHGSIWELREGETVRFECRVGHVYAPDAFLSEQGERVEAALWTAINTLEERASTFQRLAGLHPAATRAAQRYLERANETLQQAETLRQLLYSLLEAGAVG